MLLVHVSRVRNGVISRFWAQKIALKKSMKFVEIYVFYKQFMRFETIYC